MNEVAKILHTISLQPDALSTHSDALIDLLKAQKKRNTSTGTSLGFSPSSTVSEFKTLTSKKKIRRYLSLLFACGFFGESFAEIDVSVESATNQISSIYRVRPDIVSLHKVLSDFPIEEANLIKPATALEPANFTDVSQILRVVSQDQDILQSHSIAVRRLLSSSLIHMHCVASTELDGEDLLISKSPKIDSVKNYTNLLLLCGIFGLERENLKFDVQHINEKIQSLYLVAPEESTTARIVEELIPELNSILRRARRAVTEQKSKPMKKNSKLDDAELVAKFEGQLNREFFAKTLRALIEENDELSIRKAADRAGTSARIIQNILAGEASLDKASEVLGNLGVSLTVQGIAPKIS